MRWKATGITVHPLAQHKEGAARAPAIENLHDLVGARGIGSIIEGQRHLHLVAPAMGIVFAATSLSPHLLSFKASANLWIMRQCRPRMITFESRRVEEPPPLCLVQGGRGDLQNWLGIHVAHRFSFANCVKRWTLLCTPRRESQSCPSSFRSRHPMYCEYTPQLRPSDQKTLKVSVHCQHFGHGRECRSAALRVNLHTAQRQQQRPTRHAAGVMIAAFDFVPGVAPNAIVTRRAALPQSQALHPPSLQR